MQYVLTRCATITLLSLLGSACGSGSDPSTTSMPTSAPVDPDPVTESPIPVNTSSSSSSSSSSSGQAQSNVCDPTELEQALVDAHNEARSQARSCGGQSFAAAPPVTWNCQLGKIAREHSKDMASVNFLSHTGSNGLSPFDRMRNVEYNYRYAAENIARGQRTVEAVLDGWINSPDHCISLMSPNFTEIGSSAATDDNSRQTIYWTAAFGRR